MGVAARQRLGAGSTSAVHREGEEQGHRDRAGARDALSRVWLRTPTPHVAVQHDPLRLARRALRPPG
ncbi:MAG: hypothetical protein CVU56_22190 [Deltaproteobacteria bacterium HGW-Deltaproteobacteria-14]|nr:MAG: hypothetical protein CVU56_22190 [Deltaproteobacteria bacterium HGW-Deltaproteobacteria-14]